MAAADVAAKEEDASQLQDLQQHLQLDAFDGKYLTKQEILLLELFQSFHAVCHDSSLLLSLYLCDCCWRGYASLDADYLLLSLSGVCPCRMPVVRMRRSSPIRI